MVERAAGRSVAERSVAERSVAERSVVGKVAAILATFAGGGRVTLGDVARSTGLPTSTVHRLVSELTAQGLLRRELRGAYGPGVVLHLLAGTGPARDLVERADAVLADLAGVTGGTARLGVLDGADVVVLAERRGPGLTPADPVPAGGPPLRWPASATAAGRAVLAFLPVAQREALLAGGLRGPGAAPTTGPDALRTALARARRQGIATARGADPADHDAAAAPVFGPGGTVAAALEVARHDLDRDLPAVRAALRVAAAALSRAVSLPVEDAGASSARRVPRAVGDDGRHGAPDRAAAGH